ncbi:MaoC/PaaZ C-terminal domain-containing protein [Lacimicrobium sp. SS2-24]|uniref:MaoC/PaaZ C-terminal domain-containing protein n=1 Tax=Lacimicrobium sp. SS2-24 TaxID=2005569 RepID=UPI001439DD24|nr:MaoC/PaaZ C-terminal domain-containing protein [Lacimicrobium sp. SS2-24]
MLIREFTPSSLPAVPPMLLKAAMKSSFSGELPSLPNVTLRCEGLEPGSEKMDEYHRLLHWHETEHVHPAWLHCLALPLHLALLLDKGFPFKVMGLVHMENHIRQYRAIRRDEKLNVSCYFDGLRRHRLGWQVTLVTQIEVDDILVWQGKSISLVKTGDLPKRTPSSAPAELTGGEEWNLDASLGRQYAKVSGDYNPIHLYPWSARFFGFKAQIIHGMWSKGRCISAMKDQLGDNFEIKVSFRKPVFLPCNVRFNCHAERACGSFTLASEDGTSLHLSGKYQRFD